MAKRGRPPAQIDRVQFENLCKIQCTEKEICAWFGVTDKTLSKWCKKTYGLNFSDTYAQKRVPGLISLRRNQFRLAETNATMMIWLGKQLLGQTDQVQVEAKEAVKIVVDVPRQCPPDLPANEPEDM